jgi:hypothetical protein
MVNCANDPLNYFSNHPWIPQVNPWSNPLLKTLVPLFPLPVILELWHILQNLSKHFKTTQKEKNVQFLKARNFHEEWHC